LNDPTSPPPVPVASACNMLDNTILDVFYPCTCEVTRVRMRHAEPYANTFSPRIHFSHDLDLTVTLRDVHLIDANCVDPNIAGLMFVTQIAKGVMQTNGDEKVFV
jgi:hypothetical protein